MKPPETAIPSVLADQPIDDILPEANLNLASQPFALITGASQGIGRAMAFECARRGMNLILVALPNEGLEAVQTQLTTQYAVRVFIYEINLTLPHAPQALYEWCVSQRLSVNILINNAGLGQQGSFEALDLSRKKVVMDINMTVPVSLTHCFLPMLKTHPSSHLLNVSSLAAFSPVPYKSLYSASKIFLLWFSRALRYELKDTSVKVSCLCPGPTLTSAQNKQNARSVGKHSELLELQPHEVAGFAIQGMLDGKEIIVPGWKHKLMRLFTRLLPHSITIRSTGRIFSASK